MTPETDAQQSHEQIEQASAARLGLRISKWQVSPVSRGINFLGFRIWPRHKLLRKQSVVGAKRKIVYYQRRIVRTARACCPCRHLQSV